MADDPLSTPGHGSTGGYRKMGDQLSAYLKKKNKKVQESRHARQEAGRRRQAGLRRLRKRVRAARRYKKRR